MAKEKAAPTTTTEEAARSDANAATEVVTDPASAAAPVNESVTRSEVQSMIEAAVAAAITAVRAEPAPAAPAVETPAVEETATRSDAGGDIMEFMRSSFETLGTSLKDMTARLEKVESTTVVRSDNGDGKQSTAKDPFKGVFGGTAK